MDHTTTFATLAAFKALELAMYAQVVLAVCWMVWSIEIGQLISQFTHSNQEENHEDSEAYKERHQPEATGIAA